MAQKTICPKCSLIFEINADSRVYKIKAQDSPLWFADAMDQFENFSTVKCPSCGFVYKAPEARLFCFFKSPYAVMACGFVLSLIMMAFCFWIETP